MPFYHLLDGRNNTAIAHHAIDDLVQTEMKEDFPSWNVQPLGWKANIKNRLQYPCECSAYPF